MPSTRPPPNTEQTLLNREHPNLYQPHPFKRSSEKRKHVRHHRKRRTHRAPDSTPRSQRDQSQARLRHRLLVQSPRRHRRTTPRSHPCSRHPRRQSLRRYPWAQTKLTGYTETRTAAITCQARISLIYLRISYLHMAQAPLSTRYDRNSSETEPWHKTRASPLASAQFHRLPVAQPAEVQLVAWKYRSNLHRWKTLHQK